MSPRTIIFTLSICGLLTIAACGNPTPNSTSTTTTEPVASAPPASPVAAASPKSEPATKTAVDAKTGEKHSHGGQGGQVVETGEYHLELVTAKEGNNTELEFYLQKGDNHDAVPNAKVTAQVQLPDGTQKALDLKYNASGKHYATVLPTAAPGEYRVAVLSDIGGEKVNARYRFKN